LAALEKEKLFFDLLNPRAKRGHARTIRQLSIRITDLCNLRCHTCGQWGDHGFLHGKTIRDLKSSEVSPQRYLELLDDVSRHGHHPTVYLWGGEPTLYAGWMDIIPRATELRMPTAIATNATGIAEAAAELVKAPMFLLQMSIDGHDAATPAAGGGDNHATVRKALEAVKECKQRQKRKLPLVAALCAISNFNVRHLMNIYEAYKDRVDLFVFYLSWWINKERASEHERDFHKRFGFSPGLHRGWIGEWAVRDHDLLNDQMQALLRRSAPLHMAPVTFIPDIRGEDNCAPVMPIMAQRSATSAASPSSTRLKSTPTATCPRAAITTTTWWATSRATPSPTSGTMNPALVSDPVCIPRGSCRFARDAAA
jgi:organic radical activating enzyme